MLARIDTRARAAGDPMSGLHAGCEAFLDLCLDPAVRQIALIDAPWVLGWNEWRRIDANYSMGSLREGLEVCVGAGVIRSSAVDALTYLLSGALNEAALLLAASTTPREERKRIGQSLRELIDGLRPKPVISQRAARSRRR